MLAINCMPDHTHIFIGYKPTLSIPELVREIKVASNQFINKKKWINGRFKWQEGYGAFSYSHSQIGVVINYINNQEKHHHKSTFKEEYIHFLNRFNIDYKSEYLFDFE